MKDEILAFLDWAENNRATNLCRCDGYDEPTILYNTATEELIDDYLKSLEEE